MRSCVSVHRDSLPVSLERSADLDTRINLCPDRARIFNGKINKLRDVKRSNTALN